MKSSSVVDCPNETKRWFRHSHHNQRVRHRNVHILKLKTVTNHYRPLITTFKGIPRCFYGLWWFPQLKQINNSELKTEVLILQISSLEQRARSLANISQVQSQCEIWNDSDSNDELSLTNCLWWNIWRNIFRLFLVMKPCEATDWLMSFVECNGHPQTLRIRVAGKRKSPRLIRRSATLDGEERWNIVLRYLLSLLAEAEQIRFVVISIKLIESLYHVLLMRVT